METLDITYRLRQNKGKAYALTVKLDPNDLSLLAPLPDTSPEWTKLSNHQCLDCPLTEQDTSHCPAAVNLANLSDEFCDLRSYDELEVEIEIDQKKISVHTSAQRVLSSLVGLLMASSGCPNTEFLRPLTRFHSPLASKEETLFRVVSMYLLAQYFKIEEEQTPDLALSGLTHSYRVLQRVNQSIADRLRSANHSDAGVNALVLLDLFAKAMPDSIDDSLEELRNLFHPYLK